VLEFLLVLIVLMLDWALFEGALSRLVLLLTGWAIVVVMVLGFFLMIVNL